jgi:hypothetical protein
LEVPRGNFAKISRQAKKLAGDGDADPERGTGGKTMQKAKTEDRTPKSRPAWLPILVTLVVELIKLAFHHLVQ